MLADRPQPGDVYAFHGWNTDIANPLHLGGMIARIGDSFDTVTNEYWKCSAEWEEGWAAPEFNDTHWRAAYVQEDNCCSYRSESGGMSNVGAARWIWTKSRPADNQAYCRYVIPEAGTAWHVSTYRAHVGPGEAQADATSYYCGPRSSYGELDGGDYEDRRADMLHDLARAARDRRDRLLQERPAVRRRGPLGASRLGGGGYSMLLFVISMRIGPLAA